MDEQTQHSSSDQSQDISLGSGVDIVQAEDIDDIELESYNDDSIGGAEMSAQDKIKILREKLKECSLERKTYLDGMMRLKADFINYKKREEEGKNDFLKFAREGIIIDLLPVLESYQMAFANKEAWEKVDPSWRTGVEYIYAQLQQVLTGHGLTEANPLGEEFDPTMHNAVEMIHTDNEAESNHIAQVLQIGYRLNGKMIKPPTVKVFSVAAGNSSGPSPS